MLKIILLLFLLINCNDNNLSHLNLDGKNIPLNNLSILIPNRFKERITRWYEDRSPAVIRTYDLMNNEFGSYGEINNKWSADDAKGFIKIISNQNKIHQYVNKK